MKTPLAVFFRRAIHNFPPANYMGKRKRCLEKKKDACFFPPFLVGGTKDIWENHCASFLPPLLFSSV